MRIAVIGGTGLIGSQVVERLKRAGHEAVPCSLSTGVDIVTGSGVSQAVAGSDVLVNVANSPTFDAASLGFFRTSMDNLLAAGREAGVGHFVILSIVGVDHVPELDYFRAKVLQEDLLRAGRLPYSIIRATQFMEFIDAVLSWTTEGDTVRLPRTLLQPVAAAEVAAAVADIAVGRPLNGVLDVAGPDIYPLDELGRMTLAAKGDGHRVVTDEAAGMFAAVHDALLTAPEGARITPTHYTDWLS